MGLENITSHKAQAVSGASFVVIPLKTRWPIRQISEREIEIKVPTGNGHPLLNPAWVDSEQLSAKEIELAEFEVLKAVAVIS